MGTMCFKNSFQWPPGRCCWCSIHMALGISLHIGFCASNHSSLSEAFSGFQRMLLLGRGVGSSPEPTFHPLLGIVDCPGLPSGINLQLPTVITGLIALFIGSLSHFLTDFFPEVTPLNKLKSLSQILLLG